jgi:hypothetical protein
MFSLQRLLGRGDKFFTLLQASAQEARASVQALVKLRKGMDLKKVRIQKPLAVGLSLARHPAEH